MFEVMINNGENEIPEDDIFYVIGKNGIYLKKKLGMIESLIPVNKIPSLEEVDCFAVMHIAKIPEEWIGKTYEFFKAVYEKYSAEAVVLIFYNQDTQEYKFIAPAQKVSSAACDYNKGMVIKDMTMIGTIHSHANMSAFHSGTDDADEKTFDGLHITIGNIGNEFPTISTSVVASGFRQMFESEDYILGIEKVELEQVVNVVYTRNDKRYKINVPDGITFNPKWLEMVEQKYTPYYNNFGRSSVYNHSFYNKQQGEINKLWKGFQSPAIVDKTEEGTDPCVTCKHKKYDAIEDFDLTTTYQCSKCDKIVELDINEVTQCPGCLSDQHLVEIKDAESSVSNNYSESYSYSTYGFKEEVEDEVFTKCPRCANTFMLDKLKPVCPFCYKEIEVYIKEDEIEEQMLADSNPGFSIFGSIIKQFKNKGIDIEK